MEKALFSQTSEVIESDGSIEIYECTDSDEECNFVGRKRKELIMATIRIEENLAGYSFRADYKIPQVVAGTQVQQFIKEALTFTSVDGVQNCSLTKNKDIFTDLTQLYQEMETNQFLFNLFNFMHKSYRNIDEPVGDEQILTLFNLAFKTACAALNTQNPITKISNWDKIISNYFFRVHEVCVTWVMVYCILNEEKEKTQFMVLFLDDLKTNFWFESKYELFDSITHTTPAKESTTPLPVEQTPAPTPTTPPKQKRGAKKTYLFTDGVEPQYAKHFRNFLHTYKHELTFTENMNDVVNIALRCFTFELDINLDRKDKACFRFLNESCGLEYKTNCTEQQPGQKWCKEFAKVKDDKPRGLISRQIKDFIEKQHVE